MVKGKKINQKINTVKKVIIDLKHEKKSVKFLKNMKKWVKIDLNYENETLKIIEKNWIKTRLKLVKKGNK